MVFRYSQTICSTAHASTRVETTANGVYSSFNAWCSEAIKAQTASPAINLYFSRGLLIAAMTVRTNVIEVFAKMIQKTGMY